MESVLELFSIEFEYDVSETEAYNAGFETLGYGSAEPIDLLGTINFLMALAVLMAIVRFVRTIMPANFERRVCCGKQRVPGPQFAANIISFMLPIALEIFICVGAVFSHSDESKVLLTDLEEPTPLDTFCIWYTSGLALVFGLFTVMVFIVPTCCTKKKVSLSKQLR